MKKKLLYISLMILPALLFFLEIILQHSRGEYYLFDNYDGPYGYLMASLNIADLHKPGYFQHPGIVPQLISAAVIRLSYFLQGIDPNLISDTINRPEFYFSRINLAYNLLTSLSLFFLGKLAFEKVGNIIAAIFLQFSPFISVVLIYSLSCNTGIASTTFLIFILVTIVISFLNENEITRKKNRIYIYLFGITSGLLIANVISNLPILIIPFLLIKKSVNKLYFILISLITFFILFLSISPESTAIWKFVIGNIIHSGKYGTGSSNFIDFNRIIPSIELIYREFSLFCIVYILVVFTLLIQFIPKFKAQIRSNKYFVLLFGIYILMSLYIILVIKQIEGYYLLPGLTFSVLALFSINSIVSDLFPRIFKFNKFVYITIFFIILSIPQIKTYKNYINFFTTRKYESHKIVKYLKENYPQTIVISSDQTASMPTAFYNALNYTGEQTKNYISILNKKYPNYVYFQRWRKDFIYLDHNEDLKNRLMNSDTIVFHSFNEANFNDFKEKIKNYTKKPNTTFKEVFANKNGEKIYLVELKK